MTRTKARELAIRLIYAQAASDSETLLEDFLEPEHFESLASEDELFSEKPEGASLEYIRRLLGLCRERRAELDGYIENIRTAGVRSASRARRRRCCAAPWPRRFISRTRRSAPP